MRIVIDARLYGPHVAKGLGRYVQQVVDGLLEIDSENEYVVLLRQDNWDDCPERPNLKKVLAPWRWYSIAEQLYLSRLLKKLKPDLVHFPHFNVPLFYRGPFVVTIHDLILRRHHSRRASTHGWLVFWLKKRLYLRVIASGIKRAKNIITISEFTKNEIIHFYPRAKNKIVVIYEGLTDTRPFLTPKSDDNNALVRYNIVKPYLLYVGNVYPHKNLEKLLDAYQVLQSKWSGQLILVGQKDYFYDRLEKLAAKKGFKDKVLCLGYVPDDDLAALYRQAALYVFPSLYEGFGLPPLEAMAQNLPVICSDIPCLREICGPAAEYFKPTDANDMANKILNLLSNQNRQTELRQLGLEQIKKYNWQKTVVEHLKIYQEILNT